MTKRMTIVFHNEDLYTDLKVEAAKKHRPASEIVAEAVSEWLERGEDEKIIPEINAAQAEWEEKGGRSWDEVEKELEDNNNIKKNQAESNSV